MPAMASVEASVCESKVASTAEPVWTMLLCCVAAPTDGLVYGTPKDLASVVVSIGKLGSIVPFALDSLLDLRFCPVAWLLAVVAPDDSLLMALLALRVPPGGGSAGSVFCSGLAGSVAIWLTGSVAAVRGVTDLGGFDIADTPLERLLAGPDLASPAHIEGFVEVVVHIINLEICVISFVQADVIIHSRVPSFLEHINRLQHDTGKR